MTLISPRPGSRIKKSTKLIAHWSRSRCLNSLPKLTKSKKLADLLRQRDSQRCLLSTSSHLRSVAKRWPRDASRDSQPLRKAFQIGSLTLLMRTPTKSKMRTSRLSQLMTRLLLSKQLQLKALPLLRLKFQLRSRRP